MSRLKNGSNPETGKTENSPWWQPAVMMFTRLSAWVAAPVLLGVFLGKWLDREFGTEPWLYIGTVGFAFLVSMFGLVRNAAIEYKKIEKEANKNLKDKSKQEHDIRH